MASEGTVVRCGRFVDVVAGEVLTDVTVVVGGDRVAEVQAGGGGPAPAGARVLDLSDCVVAPGLIDLHTHLAGAIEAGSYAEVLTRSGADDALLGVRHAQATLAAGFTSVRDVGSFRAFVDVSLRNAIDAGWVAGPRMWCAGAYVTCTGGGGEVTGLAPDVVLPADFRVGVSDSVDDVRRAVRRLLAGGADLVKVIATGAVLAPGTTPGRRSSPRTRSGPPSRRRPTPARWSPRTRTALRGSSVRFAPASDPSSTARWPTRRRCS